MERRRQNRTCSVQLIEQLSGRCITHGFFKQWRDSGSISCLHGRVGVGHHCRGTFVCTQPRRDALGHAVAHAKNVTCPRNASRAAETDAWTWCPCDGNSPDEVSTPDATMRSRECSSTRDRAHAELKDMVRARSKTSVTVVDLITKTPWDQLSQPIRDWLIGGYNGRPPSVLHDKGMSVAEFQKIKMEFLNLMRRGAFLIEQQEVRRRRLYDVVLKLREDSVVVKPFPLPVHLYAAGEASPCHTKGCSTFGGLNDKHMICPRAHMHVMLRALPEDMLWYADRGPFEYATEIWLKKLLQRHNVSYRTLTADEMPLVIARPACMCGTSDELPCLVNEFMDCHPKGRSLWSTGKFFVINDASH